VRHDYKARLTWEGNLGQGTRTYAGYGRQYAVRIAGKTGIAGSADTAFRGEAHKHNPEDLFLAAISACHMLAYLALCARRGVNVLAYEDRASGTLVTKTDGSGVFESVTLSPRVTISETSDHRLAALLHDDAHDQCFIAASCAVPILHQPTIATAHAAEVAS
jgi:organic hydroperoxide reductase OsmC/OhrA